MPGTVAEIYKPLWTLRGIISSGRLGQGEGSAPGNLALPTGPPGGTMRHLILSAIL